MGELTPSENEWLIMEVLWEHGSAMTATEIIEALKGVLDINKNTIRVMINRLLGKNIINYDVDPHDARIYHYYPLKGKEECLSLKSERFVNNYFGGKASLAVASFLKSAKISKEELSELKSLVAQLEEEK
ncbi:MAG: BlaI/MecI/CopY family transcriptional regulator [Lachnospiraceae bacterium]|nr:BlaI/MecI/CopY family transcriptional regulator [Lachnospiraceae bacterium]